MDATQFVLSHLPPEPARVLEVGCGEGHLARLLAAAGYAVTAIDPEAPEGFIFRRVTLDAFDDPGPFDAAVASRSLHHVEDLAGGLDKAVGLLAPGGVVVVDEFAWDRLDEQTADWYYGQLRARRAAGQDDDVPPSLEACREDWDTEHVGLHGFEALRTDLEVRFEERFFACTHYLHRFLGSGTGGGLEQALIDAGAIRALGFRYVGVRG